MSRRIKKLLIFLIVVAVMHVIGGTIYFGYTISKNQKYAKAEVTIIKVNEEKQDDQIIITSLVVKYVEDKIYANEVILSEIPPKFKLGETITVRYQKNNPTNIYISGIDWFTPSVILFIGILYTGIGMTIFISNKKTGIFQDSSDII